MFSLLNPFLLWFAPLLAAPLVIHFLGRAEPRTRDFPSLLPVKGLLVRAMQRHRLKNWLLLILRTLLLLCLLLAAAGPVWRTRGFAPPESTALLLHNGAYALAPRGGGESWLQAQRRLAKGLDSLTPGRATVARALPDADGAAARFGDWPEAAARLLRSASGSATHVFLPVFDARDLEGLAPSLKAWLEADGARRAVLLDYTDAREGLDAFGEVEAFYKPDGALALRAATRAEHKVLWKISSNSQSAGRETRRREGRAEIELPLPPAGWITGAFVLDEADRGTFAAEASEQAVAVRVPAPARLCHVSEVSKGGAGGTPATLASLGDEGPRLRIASARDDAGLGSEPCAVLYLADPANAGPLLARAAAVLRAGGKVIAGAGPRADIALLNRNLLAPLGVGRFTAAGPAHGEGVRAAAHGDALARLGARASAWGEPGVARKWLAFAPAEGTSVLLSVKTASGREPLLAHRRVGRGALLLWTTSLDDPAWSDLGLGPWPALMHAAFLDAGAQEGTGADLRAFDSDSSGFFPAADARAVVTGPGGAHPWRAEAGGVRVGPFDRTGLYRVATAEDTSWFAVRLAPARLSPAPDDAWKRFDAALGNVAASRTARLDGDREWRGLYGGFRLRSALLVLAALLLFAEGVVSLRLSPLRNPGNRV
jgi:hypothetical protein